MLTASGLHHHVDTAARKFDDAFVVEGAGEGRDRLNIRPEAGFQGSKNRLVAA
jgi:hypothetical protein